MDSVPYLQGLDRPSVVSLQSIHQAKRRFSPKTSVFYTFSGPTTSRGYLHCRECGGEISVTAGTVFERTRKPLRAWFQSMRRRW